MSDNLRPESMQRITTPELAEAFIADQLSALKTQIGSRKVLLALSGGVDSSVVAALLIKAVGNQLTCVHVNHGLLRKGEPEQVVEVFRNQLGWPESAIRKPSAKLSARNLLMFLQKKQKSWTVLSCLHRALFIRTFWKVTV